MAHFLDHELRLLDPRFTSPLLDVLTDLEHLRRLVIQADTPQPVFRELKEVFHLLESLASARIEGNNTTLADYVETKVGASGLGDPPSEKVDGFREIANIERAMQHIEEVVEPGAPVSEHLIRSLHHMAVDGLTREGDRTPGAYRSSAVTIAKSDHRPPDAVQVPSYMEELVRFVNQADAPKYDLMKVALAHHRFAWVHPFGNGNGRVVRLVTYAMLMKYGFRVSADDGRLLNPAAVFCADRDRYCAMLALADEGTDKELEQWCTYVLTGVRDELRKVDRLADYRTLKTDVLMPALAYARTRQFVTAQEEAVLSMAIHKGIVKAGDLTAAMPGLGLAQRTYQIKKLVDIRMLQPIRVGARQYTVGFASNMLLRGVVRALTHQGFVSAALAGPLRSTQSPL